MTRSKAENCVRAVRQKTAEQTPHKPKTPPPRQSNANAPAPPSARGAASAVSMSFGVRTSGIGFNATKGCRMTAGSLSGQCSDQGSRNGRERRAAPFPTQRKHFASHLRYRKLASSASFRGVVNEVLRGFRFNGDRASSYAMERRILPRGSHGEGRSERKNGGRKP